jgi:hypothetical protein
VQTPGTPVFPKALASLHDMINRDALALKELSKQRLQRHMQKLASAAQVSYANYTSRKLELVLAQHI